MRLTDVSIDHIVIGVSRRYNGDTVLHLAERCNETRIIAIRLVNAPLCVDDLCGFLGVEIWGGANNLMVGNRTIANRVSVSSAQLIDDWRDGLERWHDDHPGVLEMYRNG